MDLFIRGGVRRVRLGSLSEVKGLVLVGGTTGMDALFDGHALYLGFLLK